MKLVKPQDLLKVSPVMQLLGGGVFGQVADAPFTI